MDDVELVAAARRGNAAAFEELVRNTGRAVYARIYLDTGDAVLAEDLTQETYLKAWRDLRQLDASTSFRSWLYTIAHTVVVDAARARSRKKRDEARTAAGVPESAAANDPTPAERAAMEEERQRVLALLRTLPADYREVLAMRYLLGEDHDTIARNLGITNGSLRGLLNRGMTMLREAYSKLEHMRRP